MTLPYAIELATQFDSEIVLFSVIEVAAGVAESLFRTYLDVVSAKIQSSMQKRGINEPVIHIEIVSGNPAAEIIQYADNANINLIVMAGRGSSFEGTWALGNIAAKIVRLAAKPVMLIKQPVLDEDLDQQKLISKILVPLDGSRVGEAAVPHAETIARKLGAELVLFHAVEPASWPLAKTTARDENALRAASAYLDSMVTTLRERGARVNSQLVMGHPAEEIIQYVETNAVDLIAISTHGRSGVGRWAIGSVTDKILNAGNIPIIVEHAIN